MYVVNAETFAQSSYSGISPHAVVEHEGETFFLTTDGLYKQTGDDDDGAPIAWTVLTGNMRLNEGKPCNLFQVNPFVRADSTVNISLFAKRRGTSVTFGPFTCRFSDREELREWPTQTGEGHDPAAYAVQLTGTGPAEIRGLSVYVNPHVRGR